MSVSMNVETRGFGALLKTMENLEQAMPSLVDEAVAYVAEEAELEAKARAPVRTGYLRENIETEKIADAYYTVTSHAWYSIFQEFGFQHYRDGFIPGKFFMTMGMERGLAALKEGGLDEMLNTAVTAAVVPSYADF